MTTYVDRKRWLWTAALLWPFLPLAAAGLAELSGERWWLASPFLVAYLIVPALDWLVGEDVNNPPEEVVPQLEADLHYRRITYLAVLVHVVVLATGFWYAMTQTTGFAESLAMVLALGLSAALAINTGHELGHKGSTPERRLALLALAIPAYTHFRIEHNAGHHVHVATPEDSASARCGESIYRFALREMPGGVRRAWRLEAERLRRLGRSPCSAGNEILQGLLLTLLLHGALVIWLGWATLPWLLLHDFIAWSQLTLVNYIEHYGLLRQRRVNGRYERCQPRHSWNANHVVTNLLLLHLQRHSDHHAHAGRRYQALRHFDEAPQLPAGYFGMMLLAHFPPLFFRVMDRRLLAAVGGDLARVNVDPRRRAVLERRHGSTLSTVTGTAPRGI